MGISSESDPCRVTRLFYSQYRCCYAVLAILSDSPPQLAVVAKLSDIVHHASSLDQSLHLVPLGAVSEATNRFHSRPFSTTTTIHQQQVPLHIRVSYMIHSGTIPSISSTLIRRHFRLINCLMLFRETISRFYRAAKFAASRSPPDNVRSLFTA